MSVTKVPNRVVRAKWVLLGGVALALAIAGVKPAVGQRTALPNVIGVPEDWSHHHVVFSQPGTTEEALRLQQEPRYWQQWLRRNTTWASPKPVQDLAPGGELAMTRWPPISLEESVRRRRTNGGTGGLWYQALAANATVGAGNFPAKYTFDPIAAASCANDYMAVNTSLATGAAGTNVTITFTAAADTAGTLVFTSGDAVLTMNAGTANGGTTWNNNSAVAATDATNFNTQFNLPANGPSIGLYATRATATITIHSTHLGAFLFSVKNNAVANVNPPANG